MNHFKRGLYALFIGVFCLSALSFAVDSVVNITLGATSDENNKGIKETVLSQLLGKDIRVPHTDQVDEDRNLKNLVKHEIVPAKGALSILGHEITSVTNPHDDLNEALALLSLDAGNGTINTEAAQDIKDILLGTTEGKIYDGFSLLNFNRWNEPSIPASAFPADVEQGAYKTKVIRDTGLTEPNFKDDGTDVTIWEVDVNMFWYGQQYDSDTFLIKAPLEVGGKAVSRDDTLRVNYHIYSLIKEDFAPTMVTLDANPMLEFPGQGSVSLPHKGEDSVWVEVNKDNVEHITVKHTALRFFRGIYTWGWRVHPPRIQFLDFLFETKDGHTGETILEPRSLSMATRNGELDIAGIGDAAPEKKIYTIINKALDGTITASELSAMLNDPDNGPAGTYPEWIELMVNQLQLPPEAEDVLTASGKDLSN